MINNNRSEQYLKQEKQQWEEELNQNYNTLNQFDRDEWICCVCSDRTTNESESLNFQNNFREKFNFTTTNSTSTNIDSNQLNNIQELLTKMKEPETNCCCNSCLDNLLQVYENEIQFLEESIVKYEEKLGEKRQNLGGEMYLLEMEQLLLMEEERSLQQMLDELETVTENCIEQPPIILKEEEDYWKEYYDYYSKVEQLCERKMDQQQLFRKSIPISQLTNTFQIRMATIGGFHLDVQFGQFDFYQIIQNLNSGLELCVLLLSSISKKMGQLPFKSLDTKGLDFVHCNESRLIYNGKVHDLFIMIPSSLSDSELLVTSNFNTGIKLFFQILDYFCKHFVQHFSSKIQMTKQHESILKGLDHTNIEDCLEFPKNCLYEQSLNWNAAIKRVLTKLKVLQFCIIDLQLASMYGFSISSSVNTTDQQQ